MELTGLPLPRAESLPVADWLHALMIALEAAHRLGTWIGQFWIWPAAAGLLALLLTRVIIQGRRWPTVVIWATAAAAALGSLLLAARVWPVVTPATHFEGPGLLLWFTALLAMPAALILASISGALLIRGQPTAAAPLLIALAAFSIPFLPLAPAVRDLDDWRHRSAREEVVQRIETGELRAPISSCAPVGAALGAAPRCTPSDGLVPLPLEYSWAVSDGGGQRMVELRYVADMVQVTFFPHGGWRNGGWWIVYDAADRPPSLSALAARRWHFERVERLRERWYRVVRD